VGRAITCTTAALLRWHWDDIVVIGAAPSVTGTITNTARITATGSTVRAGSSLTDTITTTVVPLADLVIAKTATPDPVDPGETITYTLTVTNTGPYTATGVVLTDTLPAGLIHDDVIASSPPWDGCASSDGHVTCRMVEELLPTQSASLQLIVTAPLSGLIGNHAIVTSDVFDPEFENNEVHLYTAVRPVADLSVAKHDTPDPVDAAAPLTYTVTISNAGPVDAGALTTTVSARTHRNVRVPIGGTAWPYPSSLWLNSVPGRVREVTVTLYGLQHTYPADLVALLTGPGGQSTVLMANAGGGTDADDLTLTFHETGAALPVSDPLTSTTVYRPTNHGFGESLPDPAPAGPYGSGFSPFYGGSPNGAWRLYVYDTFDSDGGRIADGWGLELVAVTTDTVTLSDTLPSGLTGVAPSLPGWDCVTGDDVVCTGDRLARHEAVTLTLAATAPITPGVITNTASITWTLADLDLTHNTARITTTVSPVANLGIALYLPLVVRNYAVAPDLVVDSIVATADTVTVTISNQGDAPIARTFANEFWVDVYIEPDPTPTRVNQTWAHLGSQGLVWGITQDALPLDPGETLVLTTSRDRDGAYFWPQESVITWPLPAGTEIWAQVDSAHEETEYGGVLENHEIVGAPYAEGGNILGPVFSTGGSAGSISPSATDGQRRQPPLEHHLPPRP
jgi:uncharacterized repeat protein (TIGR01451 family)